MFVGLSIISVIEAVYYFTFVLRRNYTELGGKVNTKKITSYSNRLIKSRRIVVPTAWDVTKSKNSAESNNYRKQDAVGTIVLRMN